MMQSIEKLNTGRYGRFLLPGIILLGLVLRLASLDSYSLWYDEVLSVETAQRGVGAILSDRFGWMLVQTPLHYLVVWLTLQFSDPTVTSFFVRLPSALAGSLTVLVVYGIGRELFGRAQGLLAAILVALSATFLDYSQDLRPYAMLAFLTSLSVYCLLRAGRSGSPWWWAGFAASAVLNVLNAYVALTLVMPALAPYLLWILWKTLPRNGANWKPFLYGALASLIVALVSVFMLADMSQVPRIPPDLGLFSISTALASNLDLLSWFARFGMESNVERLLQLCLFVLSLWGAYVAVRKGHAEGALICGLLICVPATILAVMSTTNTVFQRYALFALPFYYLLMSNAVVPIAAKAPAAERTAGSRAYLGASVVLSGALVALFVVGAYMYLTPKGHDKISFRPDYRGISAYLLAHARPGDLIVFTAGDPTVSMFYWKDQAPAPSYSILDPRLFRQKVPGSIYWIADDQEVGSELTSDPSWKGIEYFEGTLVLREESAGTDVTQSVITWTDELERSSQNKHAFASVRASIYQAQGDVARAVSEFRTAGTYFPIGEEYLKTSEGFAARGDYEKAWRDAIVSKGQQPNKADVHMWFAQMLREAGYTADSNTEMQIAHGLAQ